MTTRVLLTAFEPFGGWSENASLLCLRGVVEDLSARPIAGVELTTRVLPVDFGAAHEVLREEIAARHDFALHLGQAAGSAKLRLEMLAVNVGVERVELSGGQPARSGPGRQSSQMTTYFPLVEGGPAAYQSNLPLEEWLQTLLRQGVPAELSFHAGTYLCNAVYYWSRHLAERAGGATQVAFLHLPLTPQQAAAEGGALPGLATEVAVQAVCEILADVVSETWV